MSVRELVFEYSTKGARAAARADQRVRDSVRQTGRAANRNAGAVTRWMDRNRQAIQGVALAAGAAIGSILSASPTMRAQLGGVRSAFTLFSETIINDVMPAGTNLGSMAIDLANRFKDLPDGVRRVISIFSVIGTVLAVAATAFGTLVTVLSPVVGALSSLWGALGTVASVASTVVSVLATILGVSASVAAGIVVLVAAVAALAVAFITDFRGIRTKTIQFLTQLLAGARDRLMRLLAIARDTARNARDAAVRFFGQLKERVLALLDLGRDLAQTGKEWVGGLVRGVRDRASDLVAAFRNMAARVAGAFRDRFNALIPSSISIPSVTIDIPDVLGGGSRSIGGGALSIPQLNTGGRIASDGLAMLHAGERIMPAAQVRERGPQPTGDAGTTVEEVTVVVMGSGNSQADGRNVARAFQRELEDRGA